MKIILLSTLVLSCAQQPDRFEGPAPESHRQIEASLTESGESLDRTLAMMEQMIVDLDTMNKNSDTIFRAITDCKQEEECQSLKEEYIRQHEENKH